MLCKNPYMAGNMPFGCGQCLPCRINRRRQWMWRQYLESLTHEENAFVTLTYSDQRLPRGNTLVPAHLSGFLKRLRKRLEPTRVRFFGVGEYGEQGSRGVNPHYHLSLFGVSGRTDLSPRGVPTHHGCSQLVWESWNQGPHTGGITTVFEFNEDTAAYVAGYVTKKLTTPGDPRLEGRHPEFARMSNRPGIGAGAAEHLAKQLLQTAQSWESGDVPKVLKAGAKTIPLGRYLLAKLRQHVGFSEEYIKGLRDQVTVEQTVELLALFTNPKSDETLSTVKQAYLKSAAQRIRQLETRHSIWKKRGKI